MRKLTGSRRRTAGGVIGSLLLCLLVVAPPSAARPGPTVLKGTNVIKGSSTRAIAVRIPAPVTVNLASGSTAIAIRGGGRFAGIVLSRADVENPGRPVLVAYRYSLCGSNPRCRGSSRALFIGDDILETERVRLPAGDYSLYLVADGKTVEVSLPLGGLAGATSIVPGEPVHAGIETPPVTLGDQDGSPVYSSGQAVDFSGESALWATLLRMKGDAWIAGKFGHCIYRGQPPPPPVGFAPNCPGGSDASIVDAVVQPVPYEKIGGALTLASEGGVWGFGDYYEAVALTRAPKALSFYLDFEPL